MDKKGLHFLVGLGGIWLLWKLYWSGWFHTMGFLLVNQVSPDAMSDGVYGSVLTAFATLLIDVVVIFGNLLIMFMFGIWDVMVLAGAYLKELFEHLNVYLKEYTKSDPKNEVEVKIEAVPENTNKVEVVKDDIKVEPKPINPLEVILLELKSLKEEQNKLKEKLDHKVEVTNIVEPKNE